MEAKVNFAVVGAFVLALGAALIGGVLWLTSGKYYGRDYSTYVSYTRESVAGLNVNAPVKYHGVDVGFVRRIALNPANTEEVELTLELERGTPVKQDTVAILSWQGVTGIAYVDLTAGTKASPPLEAKPGERYPVIASGPSLFTRLDQAVSTLVAKMIGAADTLDALLNEDNRRAFGATLADLRVVARTLAARSTTIDAGIASASRTFDNAARATAGLPALMRRVEQSAERFDRMTEAIAGAGTSATRTLDGTRGDLEQFAREGLPEMRALVAELREAAATLNRVGVELEREPSVLVWGRTPAKRGPGE